MTDKIRKSPLITLNNGVRMSAVRFGLFRIAPGGSVFSSVADPADLQRRAAAVIGAMRAG